MADEGTEYVLLFENSAERLTMTARSIREIGCTDVSSWLAFLRYLAGGPPPVMTAYDESGKADRFIVVHQADAGNQVSFANPPPATDP